MFGKSRQSAAFIAVALACVSALLLAFLDSRICSLLVGSASVALPATMLTLLISTPLATLLAKTDVAGRRFTLLLLVSLLLLPLHQVASGWLAAVGYRGWLITFLLGETSQFVFLEGRFGPILIHAAAATPWVTCLLTAALRNCPRSLEEQALLEATPWQVVFKVTWSHAAMAAMATAMLVAIACATEIAATDLFQVRTFAEEIYTQASLGSFDLIGESPWRGLLGLFLGVGLQALVVAWALNHLRYNFTQASSLAFVEEGKLPWIAKLGSKKIYANLLLVAILFLVVAIPVIALLYKAGLVVNSVGEEWKRTWSLLALIENVAHAPWEHRREFIVSSLLALAVATASVFLGGLLAWRLRGATGQRLSKYDWPFLSFIAVGVALPGPLVGLATIHLLNQPPDSWFAFLGELYGTWFAPWFVQWIRIAPLVAIALWPAAASFPETLLEAARSDGAGCFARLYRVVMPSRWPALLAAWLLAFGLSMGELSATILVVPPGTPPLSVRVLSLLHYGVEEQVAAVSLFLIGGYTLLALSAMMTYSYYKKQNV